MRYSPRRSGAASPRPGASSARWVKGSAVGTILITGGAGFIGAALGKALALQGHRVCLVDSLTRGRRDRYLTEVVALPGVTLIERDLLQPDALNDLGGDYTHIFHLAAILRVQHVLEHPYATLRDNVLLVERVLAWARQQPRLERFVFASTSEVYAGTLEQG